jgi:hypothetical protein
MKLTKLFFSFLLIGIVFACNDPCDDVDCGPGICVEGTCDCPDGFSGVNCEIEDLCFNSDCGNGTCNQDTGDCDCDEGFEGNNCETRSLDRFLGSWNNPAFECAGDTDDVTFVFTEGPTEIELNMFEAGDPDVVFNIIYDGDSFTIEEMTFDGITVVGSGNLTSETTMDFTVDITFAGITSVCSAELTRI